MALGNITRKSILSPYDLRKILKSKNIRIIDCRWFLEDKKKGYRLYKKEHIPGSFYFDIDKISVRSNELPHVFPTNQIFTSFINKFGINKLNEIIIYDQYGFFSSSRVWFTFKFFGFKNVKILDGGFKFWKKNKYITQKCEKKYKYGRCYNVLCFEETLIHRSEIIKKQSDDLQIIDARPVSRFLGKIQEPRPNLRKGNIKNSTNIYFGEIINNCGKLKSNHKLIEIFNIYNKKKETVCYCGSGITACNIIFVLNILNFGKIKLYDGSWAEWGKKD